MPVDIDRFEAADSPREPTTSERIVRFLAANDTHAYTRREIADAIDADPETVGTNLTRLKGRGLVRHREPYWAFTDDRERAKRVLEERYGEDVVASLIGDAAREPDAHAASRRGEGKSAETRSAGRATRQTPHRMAASAFLDRVRDRFDDEVEALYLFGSVARDAETASSDVDVLAVIADEADYAAVDDGLLELAYDLQLEHGVRLEVHSVRASEFADRRERGDPFVRRVLAEAERGG